MADETVQSARIKVSQIRSGTGRKKNQIATLKGLGLNKIGRSRILEDTRSVRGMLRRVIHLVNVEAL